MPDLRDVLRRGADVTTGLPDMPAVWSRAVRERRRRRLVAAAGAAAVVGAVAFVGAVLDGPPEPPGAATAPRLPAALELPTYPGPLATGETYDARELGLPYGFRVPGPGWVLAAREPGWMSLHGGDDRLNLQHWDAVVDPTADEVDDSATEPVPTDLVDWVAGHPRLEVLSHRTTTVADEPWQVLEVAVTDPLSTTPTECAPTPCVVLGRAGAEPVEILVSERAHLLIRPDDPDHTVLLVAFPASSAAPSPAATRLLDSFHERPLP